MCWETSFWIFNLLSTIFGTTREKHSTNQFARTPWRNTINVLAQNNIMEDTPVRRKRKHQSPKKLSKNRVKKFGETLGEKTEVRIFANFDNFATFVDRAVFTFIKDWSEGFPNMVLSTEYSEAVNARYTFQPLWVSAEINQLLSADFCLERKHIHQYLDIAAMMPFSWQDHLKILKYSNKTFVWIKYTLK